MRPEPGVFVCGVLALLATASAGAGDAAPGVPRHAPLRAEARQPQPASARAAPLPHSLVAPARAPALAARAARSMPAHWTVPLSALPVARPTIGRGIRAELPAAAGRGHRAPVNSGLGGPATFDARRLVRR